jgi:hypothetical protein
VTVKVLASTGSGVTIEKKTHASTWKLMTRETAQGAALLPFLLLPVLPITFFIMLPPFRYSLNDRLFLSQIFLDPLGLTIETFFSNVKNIVLKD